MMINLILIIKFVRMGLQETKPFIKNKINSNLTAIDEIYLMFQ